MRKNSGKKVASAALKGVTAVGVALGGTGLVTEANVVYAAEAEQPVEGELVHDLNTEQTSLIVETTSEQTGTSTAPEDSLADSQSEAGSETSWMSPRSTAPLPATVNLQWRVSLKSTALLRRTASLRWKATPCRTAKQSARVFPNLWSTRSRQRLNLPVLP